MEVQKCVAVIAVHGVADQQPWDSARQAADLLRGQYDGYTWQAQSSIRIPVEATSTGKPGLRELELKDLRAASYRSTTLERAIEEPAPEAAMDAGIPLELRDMREQLFGYKPSGPDVTYETPRIDLRRGNSCECHVFDMFWGDLSRLQTMVIGTLVAFFQLLFFVCHLGSRTIGYARANYAKGKSSWWLFDRAHDIAHRILVLGIPILNLALLGLAIAAIASGYYAKLELHKTVSALLFGGVFGAGPVALFFVHAQRSSVPSWPWTFLVVLVALLLPLALVLLFDLDLRRWVPMMAWVIMVAIISWLMTIYKRRRGGAVICGWIALGLITVVFGYQLHYLHWPSGGSQLFDATLDTLHWSGGRGAPSVNNAAKGENTMKNRFACRIGSLAGTVFAMVMLALLPPALAASPPVTVDQGTNWTPAARKDFYSRDQGSRIMPLRWIAALKQGNGEPFMAASLSRYGYLPNETSNPPGLPVGFTLASGSGGEIIGMTCAACHTRQIEVGGTSYRIDGGPAIVDFQRFLADLDAAVNAVLTDPKAFSDFALAVLGPSPLREEEAQLRGALKAWHLPYHTLMDRALPKNPWGPARLDAVSMIFNRLTGLDIGPPPTYMIPENIKPADAPVRYPFLWNAPIQDKTQWPGFADNGDSILALSRNLGEVYGVFAVFHPQKDEGKLLGFDYLANNSANFQGLEALEDLIWKLGPPKWPWAVDQTLAATGKTIFERKTAQGGCVDCHGIKRGKPRPLNQKTWATPIQDVGTDSREYSILAWTVKTGVLEGAQIPRLTQPLKPTDMAANVLGTSVRGSILQHYVPVGLEAKVRETAELREKVERVRLLFGSKIEDLKGAFRTPAAPAVPSFAYESRVLQGIWAAAPYLHNGSVPTLAELLKPAAERVSAFKIGPAYDLGNVGLSVEQTQFNYTLKTTDCSDRNSGNSRCGHEYGTTQLTPDEKKALLEYLKIL